jgi:hypothetical protein
MPSTANSLPKPISGLKKKNTTSFVEKEVAKPTLKRGTVLKPTVFKSENNIKIRNRTLTKVR